MDCPRCKAPGMCICEPEGRPKCFGVFRSPQSDAENDCASCSWDGACARIAEMNALLDMSRQNMKAIASLTVRPLEASVHARTGNHPDAVYGRGFDTKIGGFQDIVIGDRVFPAAAVVEAMRRAVPSEAPPHQKDDSPMPDTPSVPNTPAGSHIFAGKPDARMMPAASVVSDKTDSSESATTRVSRFRPRYRALSEAEKELHDAIKTKAEELEELFGRIRNARGEGPPLLPNDMPSGRHHALALTALEESIMWAVKELTK